MFWNRFFCLCEKHGTRPLNVVKTLGISSGSITNWKKGVIPNGETLIKLANYFNVSIDYLIGRNAPESAILSYNGSDPLKQEISNIITDILDSTDDTNKLELLKNILIGFTK